MKYVLLVDDHEVTRRGVRELLAEAYAGLTFGEACDGVTLAANITAQPWDLVVLDAMLPGSNMLTSLAVVRAARPALPVLVLTAALETEFVVQAMKAGANGLIHKHRASADLLEAVKQVANGSAWLHPETAAAVAAAIGRVPAARVHDSLSAREFEIFRLIALGKAVKEIAGDLGLSDKTVATYLTRIREKTGLHTHVDIARYALLNKLVD